MQKQNKTIYIIGAALCILVILFLITLLLSKNSNKNNTVVNPSVSPIPSITTIQKSKRKTPQTGLNNQGAYDFTGVKDVPPSPAYQNLITQKMQLREKTPLTLNFGKITFDWGSDKFTVTLNTPKDINRSQFNTWLQTNYPAIPVDRFIFN